MSNPGFYRRRVGGFTVTAVNDGTLNLSPAILRGIGEAEAAALAGARFGTRPAHGYVNTFLVQGAGRTILIDTGAADSMAPTLGRLLPNLAAAGVQPGDVDLVLLTHFHPDHSNGLAAKDGTAVFPNAALSVSEAEAAFWLDTDPEGAAEGLRPYLAAARAAVAPYAGRFTRSGGQPVAPGVTPVALPGHTPGHTGYRIDDGGESLLIWGDIMHMPDVQAPHPEVTVVYDLDPAQAEASRRRVLDMVAADRLAVAGMHLHFPGFAHVERAGAGYAVVTEPWSPGV